MFCTLCFWSFIYGRERPDRNREAYRNRERNEREKPREREPREQRDSRETRHERPRERDRDRDRGERDKAKERERDRTRDREKPKEGHRRSRSRDRSSHRRESRESRHSENSSSKVSSQNLVTRVIISWWLLILSSNPSLMAHVYLNRKVLEAEVVSTRNKSSLFQDSQSKLDFFPFRPVLKNYTERLWKASSHLVLLS